MKEYEVICVQYALNIGQIFLNMLNRVAYMVRVLWLNVKYTFNGVQNTLVYITYIGTSHKKTNYNQVCD
jgi:hypothetical protein